MTGTAPRADVWVAVEHTPGWGDAPLARSGHGVRILMARGRREGPGFGFGPGFGPGFTTRTRPFDGTDYTAGTDATDGTEGTDVTGPVDGTDVTGLVDGTEGTEGTEYTEYTALVDRTDVTVTPEPLDAGVRVWVGYAAGDPSLRVGLIERPEDVAGWDLAAIAAGSLRGWGRADPHPLLLVCANGRRDRCCGHAGGRLADTLWSGPLADRVLTCTHLGGHRFAPTALLLPVGALHGRLDEQASSDLITGASTGRMRADTLRGFSTLDSPAQVAEAHARTVTGHVGLDPLEVSLVAGADADHVTADVQVRDALAATRTLRVQLERTTVQARLACGRNPEPTTHWHPTRPPT